MWYLAQPDELVPFLFFRAKWVSWNSHHSTNSWKDYRVLEFKTAKLDGTQINQNEMNMGRVDEVVRLGATEVWNVTNNMALPHSFHVHDVQFQVLAVGGEAPPPELAGRKDTIYLRPNTAYRLIMRFDDYADAESPYMYHCHLLWHEDQGMMGQFLVVAPGDEPALPESEHGHGG